jgi:hypothetical protein
MQVVVPLAGPDFARPDGSVKAEIIVEGAPLLRHALEGRGWAASLAPDAYAFVMLDLPQTRRFAAGALADWYPGARTVFLSHPTRGAALSALAGLSVGAGPGPVIVDLADILYESDLDPARAFAGAPGTGGIALTFESDHPAYSYLRTDAEGRFLEAAEKRVISSDASAGTYLFADAPVLLRAVAHALENAASQTFNGLFYACPLFNGVRAQGRDVTLIPVSRVRDIKTEIVDGT